MRCSFVFIFVLYFNISAFCQSDNYSKQIVLEKKTFRLDSFFSQVKKQIDIKFSYTSELNNTSIVSVNTYKADVKTFLAQVINLRKFEIIYRNNKILIIAVPIYNRKNILNGFILDQETGESLINASLLNTDKLSGTISNEFGFYCIENKSEYLNLRISYVGYQDLYTHISIKHDTTINFYLKAKNNLSEVKVNANMDRSSTNMFNINARSYFINNRIYDIKEDDFFSSLESVPGIQKNNSGAGGFIVRSSNQDKNLILIDDVPIYYSSHFYSYFSVFNTDAIKHTKLLKGAFPARYGGRTSSVLDIRLKDGDSNRVRGNMSIGLLTSKININGPIVNNKTTFNVSLRRSYLDLLVKSIFKITDFADDLDLSFYFGDMNIKLTHKLNNKNKIYLSSYWGGDLMKSNFNSLSYKPGSFRAMIGWGNFVNSLRWSYIQSSNLFVNSSFMFSKYTYLRKDSEYYDNYITDYSFKSGIRDYTIKSDLDWIPNDKSYVRLGAELSLRNYKPSSFRYNNSISEILNNKESKEIISRQLILWGEYIFKPNLNLSINIGARLTNFLADKKYYIVPEPRFKITYNVNDNFALRASYSHMSQYMHLLRMGLVQSPTDIWMPVTHNVKPIYSYHKSIAVFYNLKSKYNFSAEYYIKRSDNILELKNESIFNFYKWSDNLVSGTSKSSGLELNLCKTKGLYTANMSCAFSKSVYIFDKINKGISFPSPLDRRFTFSAFVKHKLKRNISVSYSWYFGSALPLNFTYHRSNLMSPHTRNHEYLMTSSSTINSVRMKAYHSLDIFFSFVKQKKKGIRTWNIGVKNIYNRYNTSYMLSSGYVDDGETNSYELSEMCLFPFMPSISYSYKF